MFHLVMYKSNQATSNYFCNWSGNIEKKKNEVPRHHFSLYMYKIQKSIPYSLYIYIYMYTCAYISSLYREKNHTFYLKKLILFFSP